MGTLAARQLKEGRGAEKAEGQGFGSRERVAPLMDMTMMTRLGGGSSCDLTSPEFGPSRGQGQSIGLRSRDG